MTGEKIAFGYKQPSGGSRQRVRSQMDSVVKLIFEGEPRKISFIAELYEK